MVTFSRIRKLFHQSAVEIHQTRTAQQVSGRGAEGAQRVRRESRDVEVLFDQLSMRPAGVQVGIAHQSAA